MPEFSETSLERLRTCDARLQRLMLFVVANQDCTILEGHRDKARQEQLLADGRSKVPWPKSQHNLSPSHAVDVAPWPIPENWGADHPKDMARFYHFAGFVKGVAAELGLAIRWGGDWDGDGDFRDQTFDDLVHFELED